MLGGRRGGQHAKRMATSPSQHIYTDEVGEEGKVDLADRADVHVKYMVNESKVRVSL